MFQELFFVFKSDKTAESAKLAKVDSLVAEHSAVVDKVLSMAQRSIAQCKAVYARDAQRGFEYALLRLESAVAEDIELQIKKEVIEGSLKGVCDIFFAESFPRFDEQNKELGALVMDMDMTTVQIEGIDEMARCLGVFDKVAAITHEAMNGKLDFTQSLGRRVALLEGGDANEVLGSVKKIMVETDGLDALLTYCNTLKAPYGFKTCIASGGFHDLISVIDNKYGLDHIAANRLEIKDGKFTGKTDGPVVDGKAKAALVTELKASGIPQKNIIVMGDGANDLLMMSEGGFGIAYHAKPKVQQQARNAINTGDLSAVSSLLQMTSML